VKVRRVRNYLERAGAEPVIFRLKFLDERQGDRLLRKLLEAEMRARQIFLLCNSKNARASNMVQQECHYIRQQPNKLKQEIDLDEPPWWRTSRRDIDVLMRNATVILNYAWQERQRIKQLIRPFTSGGDATPQGGAAPLDVTARPTADKLRADEMAFQEPLTFDHGIRSLDDRAHADVGWSKAAIAAAKYGSVLVHCTSQMYKTDPFAMHRSSDSDKGASELLKVRSRFNKCFILDVDGRWAEVGPPDELRGTGWIVHRGGIQEQLRALVRSLREIEAETVAT
jgi:hypothetical protein